MYTSPEKLYCPSAGSHAWQCVLDQKERKKRERKREEEEEEKEEEEEEEKKKKKKKKKCLFYLIHFSVLTFSLLLLQSFMAGLVNLQTLAAGHQPRAVGHPPLLSGADARGILARSDEVEAGLGHRRCWWRPLLSYGTATYVETRLRPWKIKWSKATTLKTVALGEQRRQRNRCLPGAVYGRASNAHGWLHQVVLTNTR